MQLTASALRVKGTRASADGSWTPCCADAESLARAAAQLISPASQGSPRPPAHPTQSPWNSGQPLGLHNLSLGSHSHSSRWGSGITHSSGAGVSDHSIRSMLQQQHQQHLQQQQQQPPPHQGYQGLERSLHPPPPMPQYSSMLPQCARPARLLRLVPATLGWSANGPRAGLHAHPCSHSCLVRQHTDPLWLSRAATLQEQQLMLQSALNPGALSYQQPPVGAQQLPLGSPLAPIGHAPQVGPHRFVQASQLGQYPLLPPPPPPPRRNIGALPGWLSPECKSAGGSRRQACQHAAGRCLRAQLAPCTAQQQQLTQVQQARTAPWRPGRQLCSAWCAPSQAALAWLRACCTAGMAPQPISGFPGLPGGGSLFGAAADQQGSHRGASALGYAGPAAQPPLGAADLAALTLQACAPPLLRLWLPATLQQAAWCTVWLTGGPSATTAVLGRGTATAR